MKQPRAVYHVATSLPNRQSSPPSLRCVQRGWRILLYSHHYTCFIENFFLFLKKTEQKIKEFCFVISKATQWHIFLNLSGLLVPTRHCASLADRLTLGICREL